MVMIRTRPITWVKLLLLGLVLTLLGSIQECQGSGLPAATLPPYQEFLYQGSISIKYRETEQGHPVSMVFIHGFGAASHYWQALEEHFSKRYNTIALDLKGFGYSDKPRDGRYGVSDQAEMLVAFLQSKNLQDVILVGHSMGGAVALLTHFKSKPDLVKAMILIDNASYGQMLPDFIQVLKHPVWGVLGPALLPDRLLMQKVLEKVYSDKKLITPARMQPYLDALKTPGAHYALRQTARQLIPKNVDEIIDKTVNLDIPVLIIWGENDQVLTLSSGQRLHYDVKTSEFVIIPGAGHNPHEEQTEATIGAMESFLKRRGLQKEPAIQLKKAPGKPGKPN